MKVRFDWQGPTIQTNYSSRLALYPGRSMAHQSPMISIPKKSTDEVDWTTPIRNLISQSYGENPDNYSTECASLQRCRQDAVRGAGSDTTGAFFEDHHLLMSANSMCCSSRSAL